MPFQHTQNELARFQVYSRRSGPIVKQSEILKCHTLNRNNETSGNGQILAELTGVSKPLSKLLRKEYPTLKNGEGIEINPPLPTILRTKLSDFAMGAILMDIRKENREIVEQPDG